MHFEISRTVFSVASKQERNHNQGFCPNRRGILRLQHQQVRSPPISLDHRSHAISSILYQRGIYPPETFTRVEKYGLGMLVTKEDGLKNYLNNVLKQLKGTVLGSVQE